MLDNTEITNRVYDTLVNNKDWPQLIIDEIIDPETDASNGIIVFEYLGNKITINVLSEELE